MFGFRVYFMYNLCFLVLTSSLWVESIVVIFIYRIDLIVSVGLFGNESWNE